MKKEENDKHYFDLGFMQGKRKFNISSFLDGFVIGFMLMYIIIILC